MADSNKTGGLKPLPKPVRPGPPQRRRTQTQLVAPPNHAEPSDRFESPRTPAPIDPDDFEFRRPHIVARGKPNYRRVSQERALRDRAQHRMQGRTLGYTQGRTGYTQGQTQGHTPYGRGSQHYTEPTLAEAFIIFLRRMYRQYWPWQPTRGSRGRKNSRRGAYRPTYGTPYTQPTAQRNTERNTQPTAQRNTQPTSYEKPAARKRSKEINPQFTRLVSMGILAVVCVLLVVSIIWSLTNKNAYAVYLDEQLIGHIAYAEDIAEAAIQAQAVSRLEASLGAKVQVNESVTLKHVHSSRSEMQPEEAIFDQIYRAFSYKIAATAIYVEGREIAVLKTAQEAEAVAEYLWTPYLVDGVHYVEMGFVEEWELITKLVDQEELNTKDDALIQLDKKERTLVDYAIQEGDTLGGIARRNNTTVEKICADNDGYTATTILRVGRTLKLETTKPYLSVKTVEEITRRESIPMPVKTIENELENKNYTKVVQEGQDGEREITLRITRINGIQSGPEETIAAVNTVEPVERIVEVGTSEVAPQRR